MEEPCQIIETKYGLTHGRFVAWNPAVLDSCKLKKNRRKKISWTRTNYLLQAGAWLQAMTTVSQFLILGLYTPQLPLLLSPLRIQPSTLPQHTLRSPGQHVNLEARVGKNSYTMINRDMNVLGLERLHLLRCTARSIHDYVVL